MQTKKEMVKEVRRMAGECKTDNQIADIYNVNKCVIRRIRDTNGIESGALKALRIQDETIISTWEKTKDIDEAVKESGKSKKIVLLKLRRLHAEKKITLPDNMLVGYNNRIKSPSSLNNTMQQRIDKSKETLRKLRYNVIKSQSLRMFLQTGEWAEAQ